MYEIEKINEAAYFLSRMRGNIESPQAFKFELSAFLSASRSVLQYALEETKTKHGGQRWYDTKVSSSRTIRFFKDARDLNIHAQPTRPSQAISVGIPDRLEAADSLTITMRKENGTIETSQVGENIPAREGNDAIQTSFCYFFHEWSGPENVIMLSIEYLGELEGIVGEGKRVGFIA